MFDRWLGFQVHHYLQALGLLIVAFGVPMNKVLMSIGTIWLAANILLKADFKTYWENWKGSLVFWFITAVLVMHLLGLVYTEDFNFALRDLNSKLPLFVIPISLLAYPIEKRFFNYILFGFLVSLLITSGINFYHIKSQAVSDYREFSLFGSHIRYALAIVAGILVSIYLAIQYKKYFLVFAGTSLWFAYYTLISQVLNGYISFIFLLLALLLYASTKIGKKNYRTLAYTVISGGFIVTCISLVFFLTPKEINFDFTDFPTHTEYGEEYYHDSTSYWFENRHHIRSFIAIGEMQSAWEERSSLPYDHTYEDGYTVHQILLRYLTSLGLTKDRNGVLALSEQDIRNVEDEISTIVKTFPPIKQKIAVLRNDLYQYSAGGNPNGNSLLQRFEHLKAAKGIIQKNWFFGVGTGDIQQAFDREYEKMESQLDPAYWNRAHNQFITFWVSFGIAGFLLFTGFWIIYLRKNIRLHNLIGIGFTLIAIASFLSEDTIETQQGVTFISLFLGITEMINRGFTASSSKKNIE